MADVTQTLEWTPKVKDRPRSMQRNGVTYIYTKTATMTAEKALAEQWQHEPVEGPIAVSIVLTDHDVVVRIEPHDDYTERKLRGDLDNYAKLVLDALNGRAWIDDRQIVRLEVEKL